MHTRWRGAGEALRGVGGLAFLLGGLLGGAARAADAVPVDDCLARNAPRSSAVLEIDLDSRHRDGSQFAQKARVLWKDRGEGISDTLLCMTQPADLRGLAYWVHEEGGVSSVFGYLPAQQRVMQIHADAAARQSRIGRTAIRYDDLHYLPLNRARAAADEVRAESLDGRRAQVVELAAPSGASSLYGRVVAWVDAESCTLIRAEFYDAGLERVKVAQADPQSIVESGGVRLARTIRIRDLKNAVETTLRVGNVQIDGEVPDGIFSRRQLERGRCP